MVPSHRIESMPDQRCFAFAAPLSASAAVQCLRSAADYVERSSTPTFLHEYYVLRSKAERAWRRRNDVGRVSPVPVQM